MSLLNKQKKDQKKDEVKVDDRVNTTERPLVTKGKDGEPLIDAGQEPEPSEGEMKQNERNIITTDRLNAVQRKELEDFYPKDGEILYSTPHAHGYSIFLEDGEVRSVNGILRVGKKQSDEMQDLIHSGRSDIAQNAILIDTAHIERILDEHRAGKRGNKK